MAKNKVSIPNRTEYCSNYSNKQEDMDYLTLMITIAKYYVIYDANLELKDNRGNIRKICHIYDNLLQYLDRLNDLTHQELQEKILEPGMIIKIKGRFYFWDGENRTPVRKPRHNNYLIVKSVRICPGCGKIYFADPEKILPARMRKITNDELDKDPLDCFHNLIFVPCSKKCEYKYFKKKDYYLNPEKKAKRKCEYCKKPLPKASNKKRRFCSDKCRSKAWWSKKIAKERELNI